MGPVLRHLIDDQHFTMEEAKVALKDWELRPITHRGTQVGELMISNNEIHFAMEPNSRLVMGRIRLVRQVLNDLIEEKGFLVTKVAADSDEASIVKAFGFKKVDTKRGIDIYWLNENDPILGEAKKGFQYDCY